MASVWIVVHGLDCEGERVDSVFSTEELARAYIELMLSTSQYSDYKFDATRADWRGDGGYYISLRERIVDEREPPDFKHPLQKK